MSNKITGKHITETREDLVRISSIFIGGTKIINQKRRYDWGLKSISSNIRALFKLWHRKIQASCGMCPGGNMSKTPRACHLQLLYSAFIHCPSKPPLCSILIFIRAATFESMSWIAVILPAARTVFSTPTRGGTCKLRVYKPCCNIQEFHLVMSREQLHGDYLSQPEAYPEILRLDESDSTVPCTPHAELTHEDCGGKTT